MRIVEQHDTLFCERCSPCARSMREHGLVGPGAVFRACPHVEQYFAAWFEDEFRRRPARAREVWPALLIGFLLGLAAGLLFPWS